jgi:hypothetical protein
MDCFSIIDDIEFELIMIISPYKHVILKELREINDDCSNYEEKISYETIDEKINNLLIYVNELAFCKKISEPEIIIPKLLELRKAVWISFHETASPP